MNTRLGLLGVVLVLAGAGLFAWAWSARRDAAPPPESALPAEGGTRPYEARPEVELVPPPPAEEPPQLPAEEPEAEAAPAPTGEAETVARPLLQQTEADWLAQYANAPREVLERDVEVLSEQLAEQSQVEFAQRLGDGEFELVPADTPLPSDPDDPDGLFVSQRAAGEGNVQRVVLYPQDAPELYVLRSKVQWLERRLDALDGQ